MTPDISARDLGHATRDDIIHDLRTDIADLRDRLADACRDIDRLSSANNALRAELRRLQTAPGLPPAGWLPPIPGRSPR